MVYGFFEAIKWLICFVVFSVIVHWIGIFIGFPNFILVVWGLMFFSWLKKKKNREKAI
jgi:hypothetical protein